MGLSVSISQTIHSSINIRPDITRSLVAELPYHSVTATIRYDPSFPYPDVGATPCNVTVGFIQNVLEVDTLVQFDGRRRIHQDYGSRTPMLDSDIPNTGAATDLAWYSNGVMGDRNRAFTTFRYGRSLVAPATTRAAGVGIPMALPGGGSSAPSSWVVGAISMQDYPRCSYYTNYAGASSGQPLRFANRELQFQIWVCMLIEGVSPSLASNYYVLTASSPLVSGHHVRMSGDSRLSGMAGDYAVSPSPGNRSLGFTYYRIPPRAGDRRPVVNGLRAIDYDDGLIRQNVSPRSLGLSLITP